MKNAISLNQYFILNTSYFIVMLGKLNKSKNHEKFDYIAWYFVSHTSFFILILEDVKGVNNTIFMTSYFTLC